MSLFIQVVPAFPPVVSGVGDYAERLASLEPQLSTLVCRQQHESMHPPSVMALEEGSGPALCQALEGTDKVLLHFSGYGYARWGLCRWLEAGLKEWKSASPNRLLVTLFHEVYATGPVWRASFWTTSAQRRIARDLARLSNAGFVTSQMGYAQLRQLCDKLPLEVLPVFSNVGELEEVATSSEREPIAVVFGGFGPRQRVYDSDQAEMHLCLDHLQIEEIVDIGPGTGAPDFFAGRKVRALGVLPSHQVSEWLTIAHAGLISYPRHVVTKSGIAAAYFAHGVLVVNTSKVGELPDDLAEGREFATPISLASGRLDLQTVATAGHGWYQQHSLAATWRRIERALR